MGSGVSVLLSIISSSDKLIKLELFIFFGTCSVLYRPTTGFKQELNSGSGLLVPIWNVFKFVTGVWPKGPIILYFYL